MKKFLKYFLISIAGVVLALLLAAGFTQTSLFRSWLRDKIIAAVGESVGGTLTIGSVEGDLFGGVSLTNILFAEQGDTAIAIPRVTIDYSLSGALGGKFHIRSMVVDSPTIRIVQLPDSTWDVFPKRQNPSTMRDSVAATHSTFQLTIDEVRITSGSGTVIPLDTASKIPRRIGDLNTKGSVYLEESSVGPTLLSVVVDTLNFQTYHPNIRIEECSFSADLTPDGITLADVTLRSRSNSIRGQAFLSRNATSHSSLSVRTTPLDFSEIQPFVPSLLPEVSPALRIDARFHGDSVYANATIVETSQKIDCEGAFARAGESWNIRASASVEGVDLSKWTREPDITSSINGTISVEGSGISLRNSDLTARLRLKSSRIARRAFDRVAADLHYVRGNIDGAIDIAGPSGAIAGNVRLDDVYGKQRFDANLRLHSVDAAKVANDTNLVSDLNGILRTRGEGLISSAIRGTADVTLGHSRFKGFEIDSLTSHVGYHDGVAHIDTIDVRSYLSEFAGAGRIDTSGRFNFAMGGRTEDVRRFREILGVDTISGSAVFEAHGTGSLEELELSARFKLSDGRLDSLEFHSMSGAVNASGPAKNLRARVSLEVSRPSSESVALDTLSVAGTYADTAFRSTSTFTAGDSVSGSVTSVVRLNALHSITIPHASLKLRGVEWSTKNDSASLYIEGGVLGIRSFQLDAGDQSLRVNGELGGKPDDSLLIDIEHLNLGEVTPFLAVNRPVEGTFGLHCALSGSLRHPQLHGLFNFSDLRYSATQLGEGRAWIAVTDSSLSWNLEAVSVKGREVRSQASIPIHQDTVSGAVAIDSTRPWSISLKADSLNLAAWIAILPRGDSLGGLLSADVRIFGTRVAPAARGGLTLVDGAFAMPRYGVSYRPITLSIIFEDSVFRLARSEVVAGKGRLEMTGALQFPRRVETASDLSSQLHIVATKFQVAKSDMVTLVIDGALDCSSGAKGLILNGKLEIPSSRWYLPAFLRQFQASTSPAVPMLVRATNRIDTIYVIKEREDSDTLRLNIGIPINGKVDVHIPRGTWVESPKLLAELSGDLVVRVTDSRPALSGTIEIMRGWVQMYGVRLNFKESKITFKEGGELEPDVTIQMEYVFRDENREKKSLIVDIRGNAKDPEIVFMLEGKEIKQEDALSYMLFGRSTSDINSNQLSDLNNSASQMMEQMTSSLISSKLSSTVGKSLGMDVIELRGTDNWSKASLTGGKYFSDQLFVSFEKGFGKYDANETIPEILTVEYEVVKFLFLQLISGTDDRSGVNIMIKLDSGTSP